MSAPSTFSLSNVYRALGMRDARVIPNIEGGKLTPVISFGTFETFAPQVVEARGIANVGLFNVLAGQYAGLSLFSTAEGGAIIESAQASNPQTWNLSPNRPWFAGIISPLSMGGRPLSSVCESTGIVVGVPPTGGATGGSNTPGGFIGDASQAMKDLWVPPGWFFWVSLFNTGGATAFASIRWREIPEGQGVA